MNREIVPKVKKIIGNSLNISKELEHLDIKPEHITLSILRDSKNKCVDTFISMGVDVNKLYDSVYDTFNKSVISQNIGISNRTKRSFSPLTKAVFNTCDGECDSMGDSMIDTTHLMLAIIKNNTLTTKVLKEFGINYEKFKKVIMGSKNQYGNPSEDENSFNFNDKTNKNTTTKKGSSTTPVLDNFCRDVSKMAEEGKIDQVIGRAKEIKRVSQILSRRKKNNPVLIGELGLVRPQSLKDWHY